jgi:dynein heavy chain 2
MHFCTLYILNIIPCVFVHVCVQVSLWEVRLADLDEHLLSLNTIQRRWVYLEPIFGRGALPKEQARFKRVDEDFR